MARQEVYLTEEGTIRCPSGNDSIQQEFYVKDGRVLYRQIRPDGTRLEGDRSDWMFLSPKDVTQHYHNGLPRLRQWFHEHGFTRERIEAIIQAQHAQRPRAMTGRRTR